MATTTKKKSRIRARAAEPSSWAGLAAILLGAGQAYTMSGGSKTAAILAGLAAAAGGAAAVVMPEKKEGAQ